MKVAPQTGATLIEALLTLLVLAAAVVTVSRTLAGGIALLDSIGSRQIAARELQNLAAIIAAAHAGESADLIEEAACAADQCGSTGLFAAQLGTARAMLRKQIPGSSVALTTIRNADHLLLQFQAHWPGGYEQLFVAVPFLPGEPVP